MVVLAFEEHERLKAPGVSGDALEEKSTGETTKA